MELSQNIQVGQLLEDQLDYLPVIKDCLALQAIAC